MQALLALLFSASVNYELEPNSWQWVSVPADVPPPYFVQVESGAVEVLASIATIGESPEECVSGYGQECYGFARITLANLSSLPIHSTLRVTFIRPDRIEADGFERLSELHTTP